MLMSGRGNIFHKARESEMHYLFRRRNWVQTRRIIALPPPDSQRSSADLSSRPYSQSRSASDADRSIASGAELAAGNELHTAHEQRTCSWQEFDSLLLCSMSPRCSGGNSEELHVGKISFAPIEVLGHGTAGTFVFRYDTDATLRQQGSAQGSAALLFICFKALNQITISAWVTLRTNANRMQPQVTIAGWNKQDKLGNKCNNH